MAIVLPAHTCYHGKYEVGAEIEEAHPAHSAIDLRLNSRAEAFYASQPCLRASLRDSLNPWHGTASYVCIRPQTGECRCANCKPENPCGAQIFRPTSELIENAA